MSSKSLLNYEVVEDRLSAFGELEDLVPSTAKGELYNNANSEKGYKNWFCKFVYRDDAIRAYANLTEEGIYKIEWTQNIDKSCARKSDGEDSEFDTRVKFDKFSIFVGQLNPTVTDESLGERFQRHGEIIDLNLVKKPTILLRLSSIKMSRVLLVLLKEKIILCFVVKQCMFSTVKYTHRQHQCVIEVLGVDLDMEIPLARVVVVVVAAEI